MATRGEVSLTEGGKFRYSITTTKAEEVYPESTISQKSVGQSNIQK